MKSLCLRAAAVALLAPAIVFASHVPARSKSDAAAIVGGLIAGAAVGAAVSSVARYPDRVYYAPAPPPPPAWATAFSPKPGIVCYPAQRACYKESGAYAPNWTWRIYAR
jgi:hypothetical protein